MWGPMAVHGQPFLDWSNGENGGERKKLSGREKKRKVISWGATWHTPVGPIFLFFFSKKPFRIYILVSHKL